MSQRIVAFKSDDRPPELAETFDVWFLGQPLSGESIAQAARPTGYLHHQIRHDGKTADYARSKASGPGEEDWDVHAVMTSGLATKIASSIDLIDANPSLHDSLVRLLVAPANLVTALWLAMDDGTEKILVVDAPQLYQHVVEGRFYQGAEFLRALEQEKIAQAVPHSG